MESQGCIPKSCHKRRSFAHTSDYERCQIDSSDRAFPSIVLALCPEMYRRALKAANRGAPDLLATETVPPCSEERPSRPRGHTGRKHVWRNKERL